MPRVSVVISTWNRGARILPTLHSALGQSFEDYEIIVVGDGCNDDTGDVLKPFLNDKVRWINLSRNCGIQSFPNNVGIAEARGEFIAYLGHDDLWHRDHLRNQVAMFDSNPDVDFVIAGLIVHGPTGSNHESVMGIFDHDSAKFTDVIPPSSTMHKRNCVKKFGLWRSTQRCRAPVDVDFHHRAASAGCRYISTGKITAHKISAAQRYLCYLDPSSHEQQTMLNQLASDTYDDWVMGIVSRCKSANRFMVDKIQDYSRTEPGAIGIANRLNRGLQLPPLRPLQDFTTLEQSGEVRGLDWFALDVGVDFRWAGPNPRPKILISHTCSEVVQFGLVIHHISKTTQAAFQVKVNGQPVRFTFNTYGGREYVVEFQSRLRADQPSLIELYAPPGRGAMGRNTLALGKILMAPRSLLG